VIVRVDRWFVCRGGRQFDEASKSVEFFKTGGIVIFLKLSGSLGGSSDKIILLLREKEFPGIWVNKVELRHVGREAIQLSVGRGETGSRGLSRRRLAFETAAYWRAEVGTGWDDVQRVSQDSKPIGLVSELTK
jgi:hypothetical protein